MMTRRDLLKTGAAAMGTAALSAAEAAPKGKADSCIFLWLGGGAAHVDTFDPKRRGEPAAKRAGSAYDPIATSVSGVQVCEHLRETARVLDRAVLVRTLNHAVIDEHAAAV